jgi:hypothetical protein
MFNRQEEELGTDIKFAMKLLFLVLSDEMNKQNTSHLIAL